MIKVGIVDYGINNLKSVSHALYNQGYKHVLINEPSAFNQVDAVILPGVGAYSEAMKNLNQKKQDHLPLLMKKLLWMVL